MSGQAHLQGSDRARPMYAWQCPDCGLMDDPVEGATCADGSHRLGERVEVVPRAVAENLAADVQAAEALLWRTQTYIGLLRQHDPELPAAVAHMREALNKRLAEFRAAYPAKETP